MRLSYPFVFAVLTQFLCRGAYAVEPVGFSMGSLGCAFADLAGVPVKSPVLESAEAELFKSLRPTSKRGRLADLAKRVFRPISDDLNKVVEQTNRARSQQYLVDSLEKYVDRLSENSARYGLTDEDLQTCRSLAKVLREKHSVQSEAIASVLLNSGLSLRERALRVSALLSDPAHDDFYFALFRMRRLQKNRPPFDKMDEFELQMEHYLTLRRLISVQRQSDQWLNGETQLIYAANRRHVSEEGHDQGSEINRYRSQVIHPTYREIITGKFSRHGEDLTQGLEKVLADTQSIRAQEGPWLKFTEAAQEFLVSAIVSHLRHETERNVVQVQRKLTAHHTIVGAIEIQMKEYLLWDPDQIGRLYPHEPVIMRNARVSAFLERVTQLKSYLEIYEQQLTRGHKNLVPRAEPSNHSEQASSLATERLRDSLARAYANIGMMIGGATGGLAGLGTLIYLLGR